MRKKGKGEMYILMDIEKQERGGIVSGEREERSNVGIQQKSGCADCKFVRLNLQFSTNHKANYL